MGNLTRRDLLTTATLGAAGAGLAACASSDDEASPRNQAPKASLKDVEHIVILIQENRSFDHYFGTRPGVRGFADPEVAKGPNGRPLWYQPNASHPDGYVLPFHMGVPNTAAPCGPDPLHGWEPQHQFWADGKLTGFASLGTQSMGYFNQADIPYYAALADSFTLCDHSFCSVIGPTTPNRLYAWTGTINPKGDKGGPSFENFTGPFTWDTYPERLQKAGISWRVYHEEDDFDDNSLKFFANFQNLKPTDDLYDAAIRNRAADQFAKDVESGDLPQVSWIVAPTALSEHPSQGAPFPGIDFTARTFGALLKNPKVWAKTVFILTYDENGGYFDHVPPPVAPPGTADEYVNGKPIGPGFRVPTLVCSPWSAGGRVNSDVFDLTSTLRLLETRFGVEIPNLSAYRRETCGDLSTVLDFSKTVATVPTLPDTTAFAKSAEACRSLPPYQLPSPQVLPKVVA